MENKVAIIGESLAYFLGAGLAMYLGVQYGIPFLQREFHIAPVLGWFITSGVLVFFLFVAAINAARRRTSGRSLRETFAALNLRSLNKLDLAWALGGLLGVVVLTSVVVSLFDRLLSIDLLSKEAYGSFLQMDKLGPTEYWIFLVWLPYFFFNIAGEELLWRGYLLPRQVSALGAGAWVFNGLLWTVFHLAIGWRIAVVLLPIEFIVPYVVQIRQNTWLGIIIHGVYNGSGFILVALGIVA
jgi:membrane protease YdiL (CAAX protease family)